MQMNIMNSKRWVRNRKEVLMLRTGFRDNHDKHYF
jgi:hypothetical protein